MATCDEMRLLIGPFDDGELEPHEMEEVAFHVVACVGCKAALDDYRSFGVALRGSVVEPALDGFAARVAERIDHSWLPLHTRLGRMRELVNRIGSVFEIAIVAAATAMLTLLVASPYVRTIASRVPGPDGLRSVWAKVEPQATKLAPDAHLTPVSLPSPEAAAPLEIPGDLAMSESQELMRDLAGGEGPSVAVWSEPRTGTTVVWVPDQR